MRIPLSGAFVLSGLALSATRAGAQEPIETEPPPLAPEPLPLSDEDSWLSNRPAIAQAFEIGVGGGFARGLGEITRDVDVSDLARSGGQLELKLGARVSPNVSLGAYGTVSAYDPGPALGSGSVWGSSAGLYGELHFLPADSDVDPWIGVGTGWSGLFINPDGQVGTTQLHGFDVARFQVGLDLRISRRVALAPYFTGGFTAYLWDTGPFTEGFVDLNENRISGYVAVGVLARFDIGAVYR